MQGFGSNAALGPKDLTRKWPLNCLGVCFWSPRVDTPAMGVGPWQLTLTLGVLVGAQRLWKTVQSWVSHVRASIAWETQMFPFPF